MKLDEDQIKKNGVYIQGDVVISTLYDKAIVKETLCEKQGVLAEGEVTGHAHRVNADLKLAETSIPAVNWLKNLGVEEIEVRHEEHHNLKLPPSDKLFWGQEEYDQIQGYRRVAD